mmetsp:Transcript_104389/g.164752  ORF Transcript_104389/g.164752 Transcript_104389/m.164752 type:complete len:130 (-) Transcript_104389:328-717(-)
MFAALGRRMKAAAPAKSRQAPAPLLLRTIAGEESLQMDYEQSSNIQTPCSRLHVIPEETDSADLDTILSVISGGRENTDASIFTFFKMSPDYYNDSDNFGDLAEEVPLHIQDGANSQTPWKSAPLSLWK